VALALLVTTCAGDPPTFYNPRSGAMNQCVQTDWDPSLRQCIATYENAGWVRYTAPIINRETAPSASSR
jgi:hypothetical protein